MRLNAVSLEMLNEFQVRESPVVPEEMTAFKALSLGEQNRQRELFYRQDCIREYIDQKWEAEFYNYNAIHKLCQLLILASSQEMKNAILRKRDLFVKKMMETRDLFPSLKIDYGKYKFLVPVEMDPEETVEITKEVIA